MAREKQYLVSLPQPYAHLLEQEAENTGYSVGDHLAHVLGRRYDNLIRICRCGYFIYDTRDDLECVTCRKPSCTYCVAPIGLADVCKWCEPGLQTGFRAREVGKV